MKCQREDVLSQFLKSELLREKTTLNEDELKGVNFSDESPDLLIEALKKLIFSYCKEDSASQILRNINQRIAR